VAVTSPALDDDIEGTAKGKFDLLIVRELDVITSDVCGNLTDIYLPMDAAQCQVINLINSTTTSN
jgi:hypothetical protein